MKIFSVKWIFGAWVCNAHVSYNMHWQGIFSLLDDMTVWPSGLRRWLQAPVRKGVGSSPTAVTFSCWNMRTENMWKEKEATARGFEPLRAEPNGFLVHHRNHSVTLPLT